MDLRALGGEERLQECDETQDTQGSHPGCDSIVLHIIS